MTDQNDREHDAWSRPDGADYVVVPPRQSESSQPLRGSTPIERQGHPEHPDAHTGMITPHHDLTGPFRRQEAVALGEFGPGGRAPRTLRLGWFLGAAGVLVVIGMIVMIVVALSGSLGGAKLPFAAGEKSAGPPLAQACPPPTATSAPGYREGPPAPPGPRTVDKTAGISYKAYGKPWGPWGQDWTAGQLKVHYRVGQGFVTENYGEGQYWASILSGSVPATVNDGNILDLKCVGQQIVADVRGSGSKDSGFYPQPNTMEKIEDKLTTVGGLPAYVSIFRVHFATSPQVTQQGLKARSELVGVATFDVGKPTAAVLYVSIPDTHKQYDSEVKEAINSVRAT